MDDTMTTEVFKKVVVKYQMSSLILKLEYNYKTGKKECLIKLPLNSSLKKIFDAPEEGMYPKSIWEIPSDETRMNTYRVIEDWDEYTHVKYAYLGSYMDWTNSVSHLFIDIQYQEHGDAQ